MPRDLNDARVTFTELARDFGLSIEQTQNLWRAVMPPYPKEATHVDKH